MKKKIIGIFVCMLLIATALPVVGTVNNNTTSVEDPLNNSGKTSVRGSEMDQMQPYSEEDFVQIFPDGEWQEFVPTMENLDKVDVKVTQACAHCDDLIMEIQTEFGVVLRQMSIPASQIPVFYEPCFSWPWTTFDFPDLTVIPGLIYRIKLYWTGGAEYMWAGYENDDLYPNGLYSGGESSMGSAWDFCFITWGYLGENKPPTVRLKGPDIGATTIGYPFYARAKDPNGDNVEFRFDWNYPSTETLWDGPHPSVTWILYPYLWSTTGIKTIRYQARDIYGAESAWRTHDIKINDYDELTSGNYVDVFLRWNPHSFNPIDLDIIGELKSGNTVDFEIDVFNNGNTRANNVKVEFEIMNKAHLVIPSTTVDVPARGAVPGVATAKTTWNIPGLSGTDETMVEHACLLVKISHPDDVDITPWNSVQRNLNIEMIPLSPPFAVISKIAIFNWYNIPLWVKLGLTKIIPLVKRNESDWLVYVDPPELAIEPETVEFVNLIMVPPEDIEPGEKCEILVTAYTEDNNTRDETIIREVCVRGIYDHNPPEVGIIKPRRGGIYMFDKELITLPFLPWTIIIGPITIEAEVIDEGIELVNFIINKKIKHASSDNFTFYWDGRGFGPATIKVSALDQAMNSASDEIKVLKFL